MTQRERIADIIQDSVGGCARYWAEIIADGLLANGAIVPPCKVGDILWIPSVNSNKVYSKCIKEILIHEKDGEIGKYVYVSSAYFPFENIGKTVFLTREEAEKALKEREDNENK